MPFDGLAVNLGNLHLLSKAKSRSISPENQTGEKGGGGRATEGTSQQATRDLGRGWKMNPWTKVPQGETVTMAEITGPGAIQQIWCTINGDWRLLILRVYWDDQEHPSVECPIGDFFACGWGKYAQVSSLAVCVNPGNAFNCYWPMPFRKKCRITIENVGFKEMGIFYQVNYALGDVPEDAAYFHAQFRRRNPVKYKDVYTILDGVKGRGHYAGTYMAWGVNNKGWWGEGEIKFYMDGDWPAGKDIAERGGDAYPTICGTGTEDYFCGSYNFDPSIIDKRQTSRYEPFTTPYAGMPQVLKPDGVYDSQMRFGLYRWHITDPIRFEQDLAVTIQALGWRSEGRYMPLQDDIASVAYWYQTLPTAKFPQFLDRDALEVV